MKNLKFDFFLGLCAGMLICFIVLMTIADVTKSRQLNTLDIGLQALSQLESAIKMNENITFQAGQVQAIICIKNGKGCDVMTAKQYWDFSRAGGYK
jgi:hypothetical protein